MRLIAVWTDPETLVTLNGEIVGQVTLEGTLDLAILGTALGALLGIAYVALRRWLPAPRPAWFALLMLVLPGGVFLGDTEFELFQPPLLAAILFLPVFPLYGVAAAALADRLAPAPLRVIGRPPLPLLAVYVLGLVILVANTLRLAA